MAHHKPIRFKDETIQESIRKQVLVFMERHSVADSAMKVLLATIAIGGVLTLSVTAPGILSAWSGVSARRKREKRERYRQIWQNFHRLRKRGLIISKGEENGEVVYQLTSDGKRRILKFVLETIEIMPPKHWDGYWYLIMFDIPIRKKKSIRDSFRRKLKELGCYQFQRSVWVHPFPCEAEMQFLKDYYRLGSCVTVVRTKDVPSGRVLYYFKGIVKQYA